MRKLIGGIAVLCMVLFCVPAIKAEAKDANGNVVITLDPGHGYGETGARRTWDGVAYKEEVINLKVANYCKEELETYAGVKVYMTHNQLYGSFLNRQQRLLIAKGYSSDALVSLHINSFTTSSAHGALAFVTGSSSAQGSTSRALASSILNSLRSQVGVTFNRGGNGLAVDEGLGIVSYGKKYGIPSMIIEHAFVSNKSDCLNYFGSDAKLRMLGVADARGIAAYYGLKKKNGASTGGGAVVTPNTGWFSENGKYYYIDDDGDRMKGFHIIGGNTYYFDSNGYRVTGWQNLEVSRYYFQSDGVMSKGRTKIGNKTYYFNVKGWMLTGFIKSGNTRYYANRKGVLQSGWKKVSGKWYFFNNVDKRALTGMHKINGKYYYFGPKGVMKTKWVMDGNDWYYFNSDGSRVTGWHLTNGKWYFLNKKTGKMVRSKWVKDKGKYYYLDKDGIMLSNTTRTIKGTKYRFSMSGTRKKIK